MKTNHPNRLRQQVAHTGQILQKKSGDLHVDAPGRPADAPDHPHRLKRQDLQEFNTTQEPGETG